jgi:lipoate-protein ligase A
MSAYKTIATAIQEGKLKDVELPTERVNHRRLTVDEIKNFIREEFEKAKDANKAKADQKDKHWTDADIEQEIYWAKALKLKEFFDK